MLTLPSVTLVSIDCIHPWKTLGSLIFSKRMVKFSKVVFVTDANIGRVRDAAKHHGIELIHHVTGTRHEYEFDMLKRLPDYFDTTHCLFQEWDAAVLNPTAWQSFLYDYIGAPWPIGSQEERWWVNQQYPVRSENAAPVTTWANNVGNGGFSFRSKQFCREVAKRVDRTNGHQLCSDAWMCRTLRPELEKIGLIFAPEGVAERFSCENGIYSGQFGCHGQRTIKLNGWDWDFISWV